MELLLFFMVAMAIAGSALFFGLPTLLLAVIGSVAELLNVMKGAAVGLFRLFTSTRLPHHLTP